MTSHQDARYALVDQHDESDTESKGPVSSTGECQPASDCTDIPSVHEPSRIQLAESQATQQSFASVKNQHDVSLTKLEKPVSPVGQHQPESDCTDIPSKHEPSGIKPVDFQATQQSFASVKGKHTDLPQSHPWSPGVFERLPWLAILSLFLTVACAICSVVVLVVSDGRQVEHWQVRPAVLLAILTAIGNASLQFALDEGVRVAWWRHALSPAPLKYLQQLWEHGTSLWSASLSIHRPRVVTYAKLLSALVVITGPLLQRASLTKLAQEVDQSAVNITIASQLAYGYTGVEYAADSGQKANRPIVTNWFLDTLLNYNRRSQISAGIASGCQGVCTGSVHAAGLYRECTETSELTTWPNNSSISQPLFGTEWAFVTPFPAFYGLDYDDTLVADEVYDTLPTDEPYIRLSATFADAPQRRNGNVSFTLHNKTCHIYSGQSTYHFTIQNSTVMTDEGLQNASIQVPNTITLDSTEMSSLSNVQNLRRSVANSGISLTWPWPNNASLQDPDNTSQNYSLWLELPVSYFGGSCTSWFCNYYSTLGGLSTAASDLFAANVTGRYYDGSANGIILDMSGPLTNQFMRTNETDDLSYDDSDSTSSSVSGSSGDPFMSTGWADPTDFIFDSLNEIMFRLAIDTSHVDALQNVTWYYRNYYNGGWSRIEAPARVNVADASAPYTAFPQPQMIQMQRTRTVQVFESNYYYLAGALIVTFLGVVVVLPTFYGFWELGREVSMSPLEIANAFEAPLLRKTDSNMTAEEIVECSGNMVVQYGSIDNGTATRRRLGFREKEMVSPSARH